MLILVIMYPTCIYYPIILADTQLIMQVNSIESEMSFNSFVVVTNRGTVNCLSHRSKSCHCKVVAQKVLKMNESDDEHVELDNNYKSNLKPCS